MIDLIKQLLYLWVDKIVEDLEKLTTDKQKEKEITDVVVQTKMEFPPVIADVIKPMEIKEVKSGEIDLNKKKSTKRKWLTKNNTPQSEKRKEYMKQYREKNRERIRQQQRENYQKNKEKYKEYARRANEKAKQKREELKQEEYMRELEKKYAKAWNFYS